MHIREFRIPMPLDLEQYYLAQMYMNARAPIEDSADGGSMEILVPSTPRVDEETGQDYIYTHKVFHISTFLPKWVRILLPGAAKVDAFETSFAQYPELVRTEYYCPLLRKHFKLVVLSSHYADDNCGQHNALHLSEKDLARRSVDVIDILEDDLPEDEFEEEFAPDKWPTRLEPGWRDREGVMTAYKVVKIKVGIIGFQNRLERFLLYLIRNQFLKYHQKSFAWKPYWRDMTIDDVRAMELKTTSELHARFGGRDDGGIGRTAASVL
ncbi:Phosphatidylinositol transfer protein [Carpediemonas membranifera]|uniref:Phosphatidylinositol transfer protein n=1 Tax=Carpediemonas membranifera TaxID=201153 RepID=A0A8J6E0R4_9EUKA|nr:Phosphatidylinositol transfer protein [Carpediemonas membranifera]|eukprot:KAG9392171.1 Phosphatidylinositol transfer protein [Carpediemonas membranifera]